MRQVAVPMTTTPCPFDIDTIASALALPVARRS
jgi:hypothetical protein